MIKVKGKVAHLMQRHLQSGQRRFTTSEVTADWRRL